MKDDSGGPRSVVAEDNRRDETRPSKPEIKSYGGPRFVVAEIRI